MPLDFNTEPYFDDYKDEKDFYRILFRPSYAVQARELTQLQTILQNQVSRFGNHVFKNGSQVIPGSVNVDNKVHFIKLEQFTGTVDVTTYIETFKNKIITGETSGVKMRVLDTSGGGVIVDDLTIPTLYCKIEGTADDTITNRLLPGENIIAITEDNLMTSNFRLTEDQLTDITAVVRLTGSAGETPTTYTGNSSSDVLGYGYSVDVGAGIYYIDGIFVRNDDLKLYVGRFDNVPSCRVGFKITETTVAPEDDESILDNATGSYNFAAPGAHRYKITLSLVKLPLLGTDTFKFIELVRISDGRVQQKITTSSYAELEKTLARRTYDESGNYEVNKFKLSVREHNNNGTNQGVYQELQSGSLPVTGVTYGDEDKFVLVVDPGKAYIQGYEVESTTSNFIDFTKAREIDGDEGDHIQRVEKQTIGLNLGNYVDVANLYKYPDIANFEKVYLVNKLQPRVAQARAVVVGGVITSVVVEDGGYGYTGSWDASVTLNTNAVFPNTSTGSGAELQVNVANGSITSITVTNGGTEYSNTIPPTIRLVENIASGDAPSSNDIVGTCRVRGLQLADTDSIWTQSVYKLGLFDINMFDGKSFERDVKAIVGVNASSNFSADIQPTFFALPGVATAATSSNVVTGSGTLFAETLKVGDLVYLNDVKIGTVASITGNYSFTLSGNSLINATNARITVFSTFLHEQSYETLLFPVAQSFIKTLRGFQSNADTVKATDIVVRRLFPLYNTSNNRAQWELTSTDETFLSDTDFSNYTLVNADSNLPVPFTTDDPTKCYISFDNDQVRKIVTFNNVPNGNYYLIASVQQILLAAQEKQKVLNKIDGVMTIEDRRTVNLNSIELTHGDIFKLVSVEMTPDDGSFTFDEDNVVDITNRYTLDNGQRSSYYTYGKLNLKPGSPVPNGPIRIKYWFFNTSVLSDGNYFSVDSYTAGTTGITYGEVPSYYITDPTTGKTSEISLTDVVDFRPVLTTTNGFYPQLPKIGSDMLCPRANYVGRIDKVVLDSFGKFNVLKGVPSFYPKEAEDPKEGLVLATVSIPPYTKSSKDVIVTQRDNRRYTMNDIGKLERRISNLEYYVTLSLLEKDTAQLQIIDETTGLDRFKNGFIVDQFTGHGIGDVRNDDYRIAVDTISKTLRPMHYTNALDVVEDLTSGSDRGNKNYQKTGDLITLPYTENHYIFNNNATRTMDIHAISMGAFKGQISLFPEGDNWKSVDRRPDLTVVDDNSYDAIKFMAEELGVTGTKWNEWQTNWTSVTSRTTTGESRWWNGSSITVQGYETTITDSVGYDTRSGVTTSLTSSVNAQSYGDRVVDMSYIPYMRSRPVTFVAQNLKGKTRFYPFFDNTSVFDYVKPADIFKVTRVSNTLMSFDLVDLQNNILADDQRRSHDGRGFSTLTGDIGGQVQPAFGIGDVITNTAHTTTNIVSIAHLTTASPSFTLVVSDASNIKPGNHVLFYNMDYHNPVDLTQYNDFSSTVIPVSNGILDNSNSSKQLNLRVFKVTAVNGGNITLANLDGTAISPFDPYLTDSYDEAFRGKLYRLRASGVVAHGGIIHSSDSIGPIQQEIHVVNIKNGFALNETLSGTVSIGTSGTFNAFVTNEINGSTVVTAAPAMNSFETNLTTDTDGTVVGVFYIPETDALAFRTGERTFRLTDNLTNSNASFDSIGSAVYYAQGIALEKERTIVSSRAVEFVQSNAFEDSRVLGLPPVRRTTTSSKVLYQYNYDPLAQTFTINSPGGTFLTSLDLYFSEAGRRPISIELRPTDNGVPSSSKTIPFSKVTRTPETINVSDDSSVATTFRFKSPVYLQDGETYAFVVMTDEPGAQVWVSEMGQTDILTGNTIAGQPLTGSLYASQNAKEWEIHTLLDMKFVMHTAKFNINTISNLYLRTTAPDKISLDLDPLTITNGQTKIRVKAKNHGLLANQTVRITGVAKGLYGANSTTVGIPDTLLNTSHTVLATGLEKDSFIINIVTTENGTGNNLLKGTTADFVTGQYGGAGISCSKGLAMDMTYLKTSDLVLPDTKIDYYVKAMKEDKTFTAYLPFVSNNNFSFPYRMNVPSIENFAVVDNITVSPLTYRATLSSTNENVSPVIDLQQLSAYVISNTINNPKSTLNVPEIDSRVLLTQGDITNVDLERQGTGTVNAILGDATISGIDTVFTTQVFVGNSLYKESDNTLLGVVQSITDNDTIVLTAGSLQDATNESFVIRTEPSLRFENNADGNAVIRTNIDTADNLLASAGIGKVLLISGVSIQIDGTYTIKDVQVVEDTSLYAGNADRDVTRIILNESFGTTATLNMITDPDFQIKVYDKFVDDTAPYGSSNQANYITRTLSLTQPAEIIKVIMDANIVNNTEVKVYYRTWTGNVDLRKVRWVDSGFVSTNQDPENKFVERQINVTGIPSFNNVQIKIVFKTTNPVYVPKIRNLRLLALS